MTAMQPPAGAAYRSAAGEALVTQVAAIFLLIVLLGASPASSQVTGDKTVVPGTRVGLWTLEMSIQDLLRTNGPVGTRPTIASAYVPRMTWYAWDALGIATGTHNRRTVEFLAVYETRELSTQRSIGIKTSRRAVLAAYGQPELEGDIYVQGKIISVLIYNKIGLAVFLNDDTVQMMLVFRPGNGGDLISSCGA